LCCLCLAPFLGSSVGFGTAPAFSLTFLPSH
jgi:hypothetical protein